MKKPIGRIPKYIAAANVKKLQRLMLQTQINVGYGLDWFGIQKDGNRWIAFYYDHYDLTVENVAEKEINE